MSHTRRFLLTRIAPATAASAVAIPLLASPVPAIAAEGHLTLITPFRLQDSRMKEPGKYDSSARDTLGDEVLEGHQGALLNVTVTETEGSGFFRLADDFQDPPSTSSINWWGPGQTLANLTVVQLTPGGGFVVQGGGDGKAHLIIDVIALIG